MTTRALDPPFPCPFCQSSHVVLVGGGLVFLHYKCSHCAEVWTAMSQPRPAYVHPDSRPAGDTAKSRPTMEELEESLGALEESAWTTCDGRPAFGGRTTEGGGRRTKFWRH